MIKEIKYRGLSTTPSDYESQDGDLAAAENIINDSRMIEIPNPINDGTLFTVPDGYSPISIHSVANKKLLICWDSESKEICYIDMNDQSHEVEEISSSKTYEEKPISITPIGKTLTVNTSEGTDFYLYESGDYRLLGSHLPELELQFGLKILHKQKNIEEVPVEYLHIEELYGYASTAITAYSVTTNFIKGIVNKSTTFPYRVNTGGIYDDDEVDASAYEDTFKLAEAQLKNHIQSRRNEWFDECGKTNKFHHPFMVRYCYKLYDGSRVMFSSPVMLVPAVKNPIFIPNDDGSVGQISSTYRNIMRLEVDGTEFEDAKLHVECNCVRLNSLYRSGELYVRLKDSAPAELDNWKDIIQSVEIYVSNYIDTEKSGAENIKINLYDGQSQRPNINTVISNEYSVGEIDASSGMLRTNSNDETKSYNSRFNSHLYHQHLDAYSVWHACANNGNKNAWGFTGDATHHSDQSEKIKSPYLMAADDNTPEYVLSQVRNATFYLFKELNIKELSTTFTAIGNEDYYLKNLTAQRAMDIQYDYLSHDTRFPKVCMAYNNSLIAANNSYEKFVGFKLSTMLQFVSQYEYDVFSNLNIGDNASYNICSVIKSTDGEIRNVIQSDTIHKIPETPQDNWFKMPFVVSYPDTSATDIYINRSSTNSSFRFELMSNAIGTKFFFTGFNPNLSLINEVKTQTELKSYTAKNEIAISKQSNMFAYAAEENNVAGNGEILAVSINTHALSQGQFGQFPIYVFTTEGIWVMELSSAGIAQTITPLSRDVITADDNGLGHVSQTDNTLLFPTKQGLMAIRGASLELQSLNFFDDAKDILANAPFNSVPFLAGKSMPNFNSFIANMRASFDYENKRIIVFSAGEAMITKCAWGNVITGIYYTTSTTPRVGDTLYLKSNPSTTKTITFVRLNNNPLVKYEEGGSEVSLSRNASADEFGLRTRYPYAFVKSINNDIWSIIHSRIIETINSYPEALAITEDNKIIDLSKISPDITSNTSNTGWFLTRPISLGDPNMPKVIDYVKQNGIFGNHSYTKEGRTVVNTFKELTPGEITQSTPNNDVLAYAKQFGAFVSDSIQQVLFGSNDLVNWVVISSSRSHRISDYSGSPYKWFRLAVKCSFKPGESLSSVTFSFRNKFTNDKLL